AVRRAAGAIGKCGECRRKTRRRPGAHGSRHQLRRRSRTTRVPRRRCGYHLDLFEAPVGNGAHGPGGNDKENDMLMLKRVKVALYERALVYRDRNLERVLAPGKYWLVGRGLDVQVYDVSAPELELPRADVLVAEARATLEPYVQIVELGDREVGLVYKNERLAGVLAPGSRQLYWRGPVKVRVEVRDISNECSLDAPTARVLAGAKG